MHSLLQHWPLLAAGIVLLLVCLSARRKRQRIATTTAPTEPGLGWQETYMGGSPEAERRIIEAATRQIQTVQRRNKRAAKAAEYARAFHAKILVGVTNAEFRVREDLPEIFRVGYLQPGKSYPADVRLSNASGKRQADTEKDLRGAAFRVHAEDGIHDHLMTSAAASHARNAAQFIGFALAMAGSKLLILPRLLYRLGFRETVRMLRCVIAQSKAPVESLATLGFWSRSAYTCGPRAHKFMLIPTATGQCLVEKGPEFLSEDMVERLKHGPVVYDYAVQLFVNESLTPIEDGVVEWREVDSPPIVIAQLIIPQQDLTSEAAQAAKAAVDKMEFNPWNTTDEFRPLGGLNRARNPVYYASVALRTGKTGTTGGGCPFHFWKKKERSVMSDTSNNGTGTPTRRCPFSHGGGSAEIPPTPASGNIGQPGPELHPENGKWRPDSKRVGIGPAKYIWWNWFYAVMEFFNRKLARNPYRKVSWDKWPTWAGLLYLISKLRFNRSNALTDPYDYQTSDNDGQTVQPPASRCAIAADGKWVSDDKNGQMGAAMTRFGSNIPPRKVRPDVDKIEPSARKVAQRLRCRLTDVDGNEIVMPAMILNGAAAAWIQFQFHNFGGNTLRDPINQNPWKLSRDPKEGWPENVAIVDRTTKDPTRCTYDGRPTPINEKVQAWVQGQIYGNSQPEQDRLRSFVDGKLLLGEDGLLLEDPSRPGVDLTGFNNNYNPHLSFLHWLFTMEHNAIADYLRSFHEDWTDEQIFQQARKTNCAQIARIHTIEWTEDLLQHPTLQAGMHADYYGFLGQRLKCYLMRLSDRHPFIKWVLTPIRNNDIIWGMPGSKWEHHDGPFQVPKHFRLVYRLHELILGQNDIIHPETGELIDRIELIDFIHHHTRDHVKRFGYDTLAWSFLSKSCGALTLHNFPKSLTQFRRLQDDNLIDLAELDIFREREDGTGSYNDLRRSLGEPPVTSFMELTGGDAALARELEVCYQGDVNAVDAGIGILAEPKPDGFALGFVQFYQFVLNAPRRVKSNRFLSEGYNYAEYGEGLNWVEHGGGFKGAMRRHLPAIRAKLEGVKRGFAPFPDVETLPERLLDESQGNTGRAFLCDLRTIALGGIASGVAAWLGLFPVWLLVLAVSALTVGSVAAAVTRMLARRFLQQCAQKCYTDRRASMFGTLYRAEGRIRAASLWGTLGSLAIMAVSAWFTFHLWGAHHWVALLFAAVGVSATGTYRWSKSFTESVTVLKIALRNRMRAGRNVVATPALSAADEAELDRLFRTYAPGRDYLTEYDYNRLHEGERVRAGRSLLTGGLQQWLGNRSDSKTLHQHADMIVEEDRKLVPAISKDMVRRVRTGLAQADLEREAV